MTSRSRRPEQEPVLHSLESFSEKHPAWSLSGLRNLVRNHRQELLNAGAIVKLGDSRRAKVIVVEHLFLGWIIGHKKAS